ncbi:PPOX class F420-dependent oxidoreductase [Yinghuangia seranimata]|uniref:PPOX class F420-dependent oxidoreductase n=1 Tax=Yinghuangia seranimata TaxID=408067 RepID=UPI00248AF7AD|nr:PPOX class F420-dependent oxidoreductase [Yinghuangia seranimata]MDI2130716.1 PPOX class F420-dependent oxidoreductase [Yinghuangia seranimata]
MTSSTGTGTRTFTDAELRYLRTQRLGRLATVAPDGTLQNNPVGYHVNADGTIDIRGYSMATSRKFRNVAANPNVALVIDDIASLDPWTVRGIEIRGKAEALDDAGGAPRPGLSPAVIRIHPRRILSWGVDPDAKGMARRTVGGPTG